MKVILLQDVPGTGKKSQVVNVSDGYARNYLFPRTWAMEATPGAVKEVERRQEKERAEGAARVKGAEELSRRIGGKTIEIKAKSGEKGRLYGSVTGQDFCSSSSKESAILNLIRHFVSEPRKASLRLSADVHYTHAFFAAQ